MQVRAPSAPLHGTRWALESVWYFWYMADLGSATSDNVRGLKAWVSTMFLELGVAGGLHVWAQIAFGLAPPTREKAAVAIAAVMWFNRSLMYPAGWAPMLARFVALPNERRRRLRILGGIISAAVIAWWLVAVGVLRNWS